jgi:hypothetical protein
MLLLAPADRQAIALAKEMLHHFLSELGKDNKPKKALLHSILALISSAGEARVEALLAAIEPYLSIDFVEDQSAIGLCREIQGAARRAICYVGEVP